MLYYLLGLYALIILLNVFFGYFKSFRKSQRELGHVLLVIIVYVGGLIATPFLWLTTLYKYLVNNEVKYDSFTIHELTDENKEALRQMGFHEGEYNIHDIKFSGFKYYSLESRNELIGIQNTGGVFVTYSNRKSKELKQLQRIIRNLTNPEKEIKSLKRDIKYHKDAIKSDKEKLVKLEPRG